MAGPLEITAANFEAEVLKSTTPVLIDFWAPWCGPCRMVAPSVEEMATQYAGKLKVGKLNVDDHPAVAQRYGITGIPGTRQGLTANLLGDQGTIRPAGVCTGVQAPVMEAVLRRAMPDIDLSGIEIHTPQRLGHRHGLFGGIALCQCGDAFKKIAPRGNRVALRMKRRIVVFEQP